MRRFSLFKVFTLVGFLVFTGNVFGQQAADSFKVLPTTATPSIDATIKAAGANTQTNENRRVDLPIPTRSSIDSEFDCENTYKGETVKDMLNSCIGYRKAAQKKDDAAERIANEGKCTTAYDAWVKEAPLANAACKSLGSNSVATCADKADKCRRSISNGLSNGEDKDAGVQSTLNLFRTYAQSKASQQEAASTATDAEAAAEAQRLVNSPQCISAFNSKAKKEAEKTYMQEKKDLEEKIESEKKKILEDKEKLNKEDAEIKEKQTELQNTLKENINKVEVKKREQLSKQTESVLKNTESIRKMNLEIASLGDQLAAAQFSHAQNMLQFAEDKVNTQCTTAVDTAKRCMVNSARGIKVTDPKDVCAGFTFTGSGTAGTADLRKKIQQVREACFEQTTQSVKKSNFSNNQSITQINRQIQEKQASIKQSNAFLANSQNDTTAANTEADKEKTTVETNIETQTANLTEKLKAQTENINARMQVSQERITKLRKDIENLTIKKKFDAGAIMEEAEEAMDTAESKRVAAENACCYDARSTDEKTKKPKEDGFTAQCDKVMRGSTSPNPGKRTKAGKSR